MNIRRASVADSQIIAQFNAALAQETESIELIPEVIEAGVQALLENSNYGFYCLAEKDKQVVGSIMVTTEWSDWRNGLFWWVQSVYVLPEFRRQGIYRAMYEHIKALAEQEPNVCGFRLYVEHQNSAAQQTYESMGMTMTPYRMFEELKPGIEFARA